VTSVNRAVLIILVHQVLFQGTFLVKNILLSRKLGIPVRGKNREATVSIAYFIVFIAVSIALAAMNEPFGTVDTLSEAAALPVALGLLTANLVVGSAALIGLRDSWRVGVMEDQRTDLIESGIYRYSRNPYFLSYLLMFAAYTILLRSVVLLALSLIGAVLIHSMVLKEEKHLLAMHGETYRRYRERAPRYLIV